MKPTHTKRQPKELYKFTTIVSVPGLSSIRVTLDVHDDMTMNEIKQKAIEHVTTLFSGATVGFPT
ncbi:MAG: hypothetical protein LLF76_02620 [Planctomycetaceae bacterium]|nr:hypothetical protein [Planctomycetaceae bacterium]